jgi:hypothetical protein
MNVIFTPEKQKNHPHKDIYSRWFNSLKIDLHSFFWVDYNKWESSSVDIEITLMPEGRTYLVDKKFFSVVFPPNLTLEDWL